jgi:hypothetical protein
MKPFYFKINESQPIMVIPDTDAHLDGHPVLTYSYTLYKSRPGHSVPNPVKTDQLLEPDKRKNPDYLGTISFDLPYKAFSYISDGMNELSGDEVQEIIEKITRYRKNPNLWAI